MSMNTSKPEDLNDQELDMASGGLWTVEPGGGPGRYIEPGFTKKEQKEIEESFVLLEQTFAELRGPSNVVGGPATSGLSSTFLSNAKSSAVG